MANVEFLERIWVRVLHEHSLALVCIVPSPLFIRARFIYRRSKRGRGKIKIDESRTGHLDLFYSIYLPEFLYDLFRQFTWLFAKLFCVLERNSRCVVTILQSRRVFERNLVLGNIKRTGDLFS